MEVSFYWFMIWSVSYMVLVSVLKVGDYLWWRPRRIQVHFFKQGIRGPPYRFLLGNTRELVGLMLKVSSQPMPLSHNILPRVLPFYHHWKKIYGPTFLAWFGPTARLTISDPALIREILILKPELFEKTEPPPSVRKLEGDGLLTLKGEKWAHHTKIITPFFYIENLKLMIPIMGKSMAKMLDRWSEMSSSSGMVEIEVSKWFQTLTEEVITHAAFGSSYEDGKAIFELQAQQVAYAVGSYHKVFIPGNRFLPTKKNRDSWRLDREIEKSLINLINKRINNNNSSSNNETAWSNECPSDLLELMIKSTTTLRSSSETNNQINNINSWTTTTPHSPVSSVSESTITIHDIIEECKTIFFAGNHTTSALLTWTTVLLAMHPHWQRLARDEVLRVCGARDTIPSKDDVAKLKTVGMILSETLRLYPPAVALLRRAQVAVDLGGRLIPCGTELLIPILAVHHDPGLWGHDAAEFNPARFDRGVTHAAKHPTAFMPFGLGPRRCAGRNLAILQAKLAVAMILQRFSFELAPSYQHAPTVVMLLNPQYGAPIIFHKL